MNRAEYLKQYHRKWYLEVVRPRKEAYFKDKKCIRCGSREDLEIHHVDPNKKLGHTIWSWSEQKRQEELAKCVVLCHRCHQEHHRRKMVKHGISRYEHGCRCSVCKNARREKTRRALARRKAVAISTS